MHNKQLSSQFSRRINRWKWECFSFSYKFVGKPKTWIWCFCWFADKLKLQEILVSPCCGCVVVVVVFHPKNAITLADQLSGARALKMPRGVNFWHYNQLLRNTTKDILIHYQGCQIGCISPSGRSWKFSSNPFFAAKCSKQFRICRELRE